MELRTEASRRDFLRAMSIAVPAALGVGAAREKPPTKVAITLDLEMSRHYPTRDRMEWDYEKGNLDEPTKRYAVEAAARVKRAGGRIHFFLVGRVLEQENVGWLETLLAEGHPVGNHTYDHVNVKATRTADLQFRFQRAPWLIEGLEPAEVVRRNIETTTRAMKSRVGATPSGFRTPGGFQNGLKDRPDVQRMLLDSGFKWVSSLYPPHPTTTPGQDPDDEVIEGIVAAQELARPFVYETGLVEVPMNPVSDVTGFRTGRWSPDAFLEVTRRSLAHNIAAGLPYDFLAHPSCLVVADPDFRIVELVCEMVKRSNGRATFASLDEIAAEVSKT